MSEVKKSLTTDLPDFTDSLLPIRVIRVIRGYGSKRVAFVLNFVVVRRPWGDTFPP